MVTSGVHQTITIKTTYHSISLSDPKTIIVYDNLELLEM